VRGIHGLRGAIRVEVLTDRPTERFVPGVILHPEGTDTPLTIASAEAVADGPGWRLRFDEIADRNAAEGLRGAYLETVVRPEQDLARGEFYWHEVVGVTVRGVDGVDLGTVRDIYRVGETEVFSVAGGPFGPFDLPAVRAFIRIFAPRRGEIVVDADALDLQAPKSRPEGEERPKAPRRRTRRPRSTEGTDVLAGPTAADGTPAPDGTAAEPGPAPAGSAPEPVSDEPPTAGSREESDATGESGR
jgi:16S rRNA processing protein RimM